MKTFVDRLVEGIQDKESILCLGLDPQVRYIPEHILEQGYNEADSSIEGVARAIVIFNEAIIKAVAPFVAIAKPQTAFYEKYGGLGLLALEKTIAMCKEMGLLVLEDAKRCDGGDTAEAYASGHLGDIEVWNPRKVGIEKDPSVLDFDAMTVVPYIGESCLAPFLEVVKQHKKGIFVVDKTSFKPNSAVEQIQTVSGLKVWEEVALLVRQWSDGPEYRGEYGSNVGVVMGATYPEDATKMREILPDCFFLVPGYGAQGGGADGAITGIREDGLGVIVNSSRDIDYAYLKGSFACDPKDFAEASAKAAEFAKDDLNAALKRRLGKLPW